MAATAQDLDRRCPCGRSSCAAGGTTTPATGRDRWRLHVVPAPERSAGTATLHGRSATRARPRRHRAVVRRRRIVAVLLVAMTALTVAAVIAEGPQAVAGADALGRAGVAAPTSDISGSASRPDIVVVPDGGSVWDSVVPFIPGGTSPHEWVARVLDANDVDATAVRPGTVLRLPAAS